MPILRYGHCSTSWMFRKANTSNVYSIALLHRKSSLFTRMPSTLLAMGVMRHRTVRGKYSAYWFLETPVLECKKCYYLTTHLDHSKSIHSKLVWWRHLVTHSVSLSVVDDSTPKCCWNTPPHYTSILLHLNASRF